MKLIDSSTGDAVYEFPLLNYGLGFTGLIAVWFTTHSGWALFWCVVAGLHIRFRVKERA